MVQAHLHPPSNHPQPTNHLANHFNQPPQPTTLPHLQLEALDQRTHIITAAESAISRVRSGGQVGLGTDQQKFELGCGVVYGMGHCFDSI